VRVLLVEDDTDLRDATSEVLVDAGFDVVVASDGLAAWQHLEAGASPDVIVLDLMMPVMDGHTFRKKQLVSRHRTIPIVVVTAGAPDDETVALLRSCAFLGKPFDSKLLVAEVRRCATRPAA
jgi:two-component system, OmpR family, response regulator